MLELDEYGYPLTFYQDYVTTNHIATDRAEAYRYLEQEWGKWYRHQPDAPPPPPPQEPPATGSKKKQEKSTAQINYEQQISAAKAQGLNAAFEGLDRYFDRTYEVQDSLLEMSVEAAQKVIIGEALLLKLDQNPITDEAGLKSAIKDALGAIMPGKSFGFKDEGQDGKLIIIPALAPELLSAVRKTRPPAGTKNEAHVHSQALHDAVRSWVAAGVFPLGAYDKEEFKRRREDLTQKLNNYERRIRTGCREEDSLRLLPDRIARIKEIEEFRNGEIRKLPRQSPALGVPDIVDETEEGKRKGFLDLDDYLHPLIRQLNSMNTGLKKLADSASNEDYRRLPSPSVIIHESGIKSWKRSIDKLVENYDFDWSRIKDGARIAVAFSHADPMFYYNRTLLALANSARWATAEDRGITMSEHGAWNWFVNLRYPDSSQLAEVKLVDQAQLEFESVSHKLYDCMRQVEEGRAINFDTITAEKYEKFLKYTQAVIYPLLNGRSEIARVPGLERQLEIINRTAGIHADGQEGRSNHARRLYNLLDYAHILNCAAATTRSAPSMAALYDIRFREMSGKRNNVPSGGEGGKEEAYAKGRGDSASSFSTGDLEDVQRLLADWQAHRTQRTAAAGS